MNYSRTPWKVVLGIHVFLRLSDSKDQVGNESQAIRLASVWITRHHLLPIEQWATLLVSEKQSLSKCLFWILNSPWTLVAWTLMWVLWYCWHVFLAILRLNLRYFWVHYSASIEFSLSFGIILFKKISVGWSFEIFFIVKISNPQEWYCSVNEIGESSCWYIIAAVLQVAEGYLSLTVFQIQCFKYINSLNPSNSPMKIGLFYHFIDEATVTQFG